MPSHVMCIRLMIDAYSAVKYASMQQQKILTQADTYWFMDCSKTEQGTGARIFYLNPRVKRFYLDNTMIFQSEIYTIEVFAKNIF